MAEALVEPAELGTRRRVPRLALLVLLGLVVLPWIEPDKFTLHILSLIAIASIAAMGLQVLLGYSGQLSIGQAAFYGIGAYTSAIAHGACSACRSRVALSPPAVAAAVASLLMVPITRLTGAYLAVATLGFSILIYLVLKNEEWLTGGSYRYYRHPPPLVIRICAARFDVQLLFVRRCRCTHLFLVSAH